MGTLPTRKDDGRPCGGIGVMALPACSRAVDAAVEIARDKVVDVIQEPAKQ
jgi:hypothetical protein